MNILLHIFIKKANVFNKVCRCGGIGRRKGLKIPRPQKRAGSSPASGTKSPEVYSSGLLLFLLNI